MDRRRELIDHLAQGLQHPDVSGFELLELLDMRSRIAMQEPLPAGDATTQSRLALSLVVVFGRTNRPATPSRPTGTASKRDSGYGCTDIVEVAGWLSRQPGSEVT